MNEKQDGYLRLAEASLSAAKTLLQSKTYPGFIVSRAYYTMFYCASALLEDLELRYSKHGHVIGAFGREFAKSAKLPSKFHAYLREAFDSRVIGDYEPDMNLTEEDALETIRRAEEFLAETRQYLTKS